MPAYIAHPIGHVQHRPDGPVVLVTPEYAAALHGLAGFSHAIVLWWADQVDDPELRTRTELDGPYAGGPDTLGVFATRSPVRPNPIGLSVARILGVEEGLLRMDWLDAEDGTPVLDIKPYSPSADRPAHPAVPDWAADWPATIEESADFDWSRVFPHA